MPARCRGQYRYPEVEWQFASLADEAVAQPTGPPASPNAGAGVTPGIPPCETCSYMQLG